MFGSDVDSTIQNFIQNLFQKFEIDISYIRFRSRTDHMVSAYRQFFVIETKNNRIQTIFSQMAYEAQKISNGDIMLHSIEESEIFTKTYGEKTYVYKIIDNKNAVTNKTHYYFNLKEEDIRNIKTFLEQINGQKIDYEIFCKDIKDNRRPTIQINSFRVIVNHLSHNLNEILIFVTGDCFMYKQIRMIIGTILKIIQTKRDIGNFSHFVSDKLNKKYVYTAPSHALYLINAS